MTLEEALEASGAEPVNDIFQINQENRTITVPESERIFGVSHDGNTERKHFRCPKIVGDNIDLSTMHLYINYQNANGQKYPYLVEDVQTDGDYITFSWLIGPDVVAYKGQVKFIVCAKKGDGAIPEWNTTLAEGTVLEGLEAADEVVERNPDIITQLLNRMHEVEKIATKEEMQEYVNTYLTEHPGEIDETLTDPKKAAPADVVGSLKEDLELMQRSMLLYIEDGNIIDNYYISIRTLDINKKYAFFIIPSVDGIYTVQAGTANSTDKMIDTIASSVEILSSIGYMFYGYSPSISNINTLRLSGNVQWNLKVYEVCDSNHFLENSKRIEKNYILLSELFLTEDIILENPNYKLNKEIGTYVQTISAIATSNKIPCIPGDMIEYTLSSDGAVFVTYDNNGNVITVANSTGYSDIKTATHTFLSEEVSFRVSGSIDRYNKGLYSLKYKAGLKRFEKLENNLSIVNANIVDINDNIAENSKDIEKIKNSNINENLKPNDTYETDGCIYRCYNPYKNSGNLTLTGQLHCHTVGTGSGETQYMTPEQLCQYYKDNGYDFMTITDYSHINYYNGKPTHPITLPENFVWLCDSFEVSIPSDAKHPIKHMCLYNIQDNITISEYKSIQDMVDICKSVGGIISMAHPMYISTYYTSNMMKEVDNGLRFCEVYDGLIHSKGEERHPDDKETDFAWETLLDNGVITWGIAISDQHVANDFKNGCVKVFSDTLSRIEIMKNLCCGNFYATTNSDKKLNKISFENGEVIVETGDANAVVSFKKENGELLDTIIGEMAKYKLTGTEKYVRAIVTFEDGEKIWTQPIINISNMSDNYFA